MIQVRDIRVRESGEKDMGYGNALAKALKLLRISERDITKVRILRRSLDARKKPELFFIYTLGITLKDADLVYRILKHCKDPAVSAGKAVRYSFPKPRRISGRENRPVIAGFGPAGMFAAYYLARAGLRPIVIEQGAPIEECSLDVKRFWEGAGLKPCSNVQFGEGGAGAFSDGKLNTGNQDRDGVYLQVLKDLVSFGAPEEILYDAKPHLGTDVLHRVVKALRQRVTELGGEIRFHTKLVGVSGFGEQQALCCTLRSTDEKEDGLEEELTASCLLLGIGHSARDTFRMLSDAGFAMEKKPFAAGLRVEHSQKLIDHSQYGRERGILPAASYKLTGRTASGRSVYSFCMCPGGYVVNAASEEGGLAVNGMSYSDRGGGNANSAIVLSVTPADFPGEDVLSGMEWQRSLEQRAFALGEGKIPWCTLGEFRAKRLQAGGESPASLSHPEALDKASPVPAHKGLSRKAPIWELFSEELYNGFLEGMEEFGKKIKGFDAPDTILCAIESRTSSPVRILRDSETCEAPGHPGIFPCGEGAGYAGGILSSAADGIRCAAIAVKRFY